MQVDSEATHKPMLIGLIFLENIGGHQNITILSVKEKIMSEIIKANFNKNYKVELAMRDAIRDAIYKFGFETSLASTLGVLELVKIELIQEAE